MRSSVFLCTVAVFFPFVHATTVFIDKSCKERTDWDDYWSETMNMAKRTSERLRSSSDTDFARIYRKIMQFQSYDVLDGAPVDDQIKNYFSGIASLTDITPDADAPDEHFWASNSNADIRIFCDDDAVLPELPVLETFEFNTNGRHVRTDDGAYLDIKNGLKYNLPPCRAHEGVGGVHTRDDFGVAFAEHFPAKMRYNKPHRSVISLCGKAWDTSKGELKLRHTDLSSDPDFDLTTFGYRISDFSRLISATLIHELAHAMSTAIQDRESLPFPPDNKQTPYDWVGVIYQVPTYSWVNAENYAYLALWALVADAGRGYTMERVDPNDQESVAREAEGRLMYYNDITE